MPRISAFHGHPPPHLHARYAEHEAHISIEDGDLLNGNLPRRAVALIQEWIDLHRQELESDWELARRGEPLATVDPLP